MLKMSKKSTQPASQKNKLVVAKPNQHKVKVIDTDGSVFHILTTWGKEDQVLHLDLSPKNHPAWQQGSGHHVNSKDAQVTKFKDKFGDFNF